MHIIEANGERMIVKSLDGHESATVVASNVPPRPHDCCEWDGSKWVEDKQKKDRMDELARLKRMNRLEFLEECVKRSKLI